MDSSEIRAELKAKGLNFSMIAEALEVSPQHVSRVARRKENSRRVALALAKAIGKTVKSVFPDKPEYARPPATPAARKRAVRQLRRDLGDVASA